MSAQRRSATKRRSDTRRNPTPTAAPVEESTVANGEPTEAAIRRSKVAPRVTAEERARERVESKAAARKGADEAKSGSGIGGRFVRTERTAGIRKFSRETVAEIKKVNWPDRETTRNLTLVVIAVSVALGLVLGGLDYMLFQIFEALP